MILKRKKLANLKYFNKYLFLKLRKIKIIFYVQN